MKRNKYLNTFDTTSEYETYIESAEPGFPNVALTKDTGNVHYTRTSPNDYQIWGTTTATSNFNIKLNRNNVEVTVDPDLGEFYLQGWTGTLTDLYQCFNGLTHITSIKKFVLDTSAVTNIGSMFGNCNSLTSISLIPFDLNTLSSSTDSRYSWMYGCSSLTDVYITVEATLMKLTDNLTSQGSSFIPSSATIHYNGVDYKWQNNAWTPQS